MPGSFQQPPQIFDEDDDKYLFDQERLFTPETQELKLDNSFKDEVAKHYKKSVEMKSKMKVSPVIE